MTTQPGRQVEIHFHAYFSPLLPHRKRDCWFACPLHENQTVKHLIESLGVPHTEIGLVRANGLPVSLETLVQPGDRLEVEPNVFPERPVPLTDRPRFVLDTHLGRLAAYLRMLGFDALYQNQAEDADLARISHQERRILLTRDRGLLKRNEVSQGFLVIADDPRRQARAVLRRYAISDVIHPFERCLRCNGLLVPIEKHAVEERLPAETRRWYHKFWLCPQCGGIYWKGAHHKRMMALIDQILRSD